MKPVSMAKFERASLGDTLSANGGKAVNAQQDYSDVQYSTMTEAAEVIAESKLR